MAGKQGFEPRLYDPESHVLPLDDFPALLSYYYTDILILVNPLIFPGLFTGLSEPFYKRVPAPSKIFHDIILG
jgi:hypothetical protein